MTRIEEILISSALIGAIILIISKNNKVSKAIKYNVNKLRNYAMSISENGLNEIKHNEGLKLTVYKDIAGYWTIGYGHKIVKTDNIFPYGDRKTITIQEAENILRKDVARVSEATILKYVTVPLNQNQYDALCSLIFNIGPENFKKSSLLTALNAGNYDLAGQKFTNYAASGGVHVNALYKRREREREIFYA